MSYKATRDITQARVAQGADETIEYTLTTTNVASDPTSPSVKVYDLTNSNADVSDDVLSGTTTASGDVITLEEISSLTAGRIYQVVVSYTVGSSTYDQLFVIVCSGFTYIGDLSSDRDKTRFYLNDTDPGDGPLPGDRNFSDNEIDGLVTMEGTWQRAVAAGFEALASAWAMYVDTQVGPRREQMSQVSEQYEKLAAKWRKTYGPKRPMWVAGIIRVDGYSDDVPSDDVTPTSLTVTVEPEYS